MPKKRAQLLIGTLISCTFDIEYLTLVSLRVSNNTKWYKLEKGTAINVIEARTISKNLAFKNFLIRVSRFCCFEAASPSKDEKSRHWIGAHFRKSF